MIASVPNATADVSGSDATAAAASSSAATETVRAAQADGAGRVGESQADSSEFAEPSRYNHSSIETIAPTRYNRHLYRGTDEE
jgi:hypothetical protein